MYLLKLKAAATPRRGTDRKSYYACSIGTNFDDLEWPWTRVTCIFRHLRESVTKHTQSATEMWRI